MSTPALMSLGQTTLPDSVRDILDLQPDDRAKYVLKEDHVVLHRATAALRALDRLLDRLERGPVSVEAMEEAIEHAAGELAIAPTPPLSLSPTPPLP